MSFWSQLLLNAIVGGALSTIVGVVVGFLFKRWLRSVFEPEQKATTAAANKAASSAVEARDASQTAAKHALELKEANGRFVAMLPEREDAVEYLKETNSRLLAELVIQASKHPEDFDSPTAPRFEHPTAVPEEVYVTGRHALHGRA